LRWRSGIDQGIFKTNVMPVDIRDRRTVSHEDVATLNFIRSDTPFYFRRYYRNGLRSHVMEVLRAEDVARETEGVLLDGIPRFPTARPVKMLRIFRRRFNRFGEALDEIKRLQIIEKYLEAGYVARSDEFVAEYRIPGKRDILLCGLQTFVHGEELEPWHPLRLEEIPDAIRSLQVGAGGTSRHNDSELIRTFQRSVDGFVRGVKAMIMEARYVPDLAGKGNMLLTPSGSVALVDINNISPVSFTEEIYLDDIGYPVCDKSIEALLLLEQCFLGRIPDLTEPCYRHFMDPERKRRVADLDRSFHRTIDGTFPK
jgi:hypothetical protein